MNKVRVMPHAIMSYMKCSQTYPTIIPGICLTVSGPGMIHALAGMANAFSNLWPMIVLSGCPDQSTLNMGAFQEMNQLALARAVGCVFTRRATSIQSIPKLLYHAFQASIDKRASSGTCFIEFPADVICSHVSCDELDSLFDLKDRLYLQPVTMLPISIIKHDLIQETIQSLVLAKRPLMIIGKGSSFACAEESLRRLIHRLCLPFLPMPMAKGVLPDEHPWCISSARSLALRTTDLVILVGVRLNWMLNFGRVPTFSKECRFIQIDQRQETFHMTRNLWISLHGDIRTIIDLIDRQCEKQTIQLNIQSTWIEELQVYSRKNQETLRHLCEETQSRLTYYQALSILNHHMEKNTIWIIEGANTMDLSRLIIKHDIPRCRFDAGSSGTMGIGFGYAIGAALSYPGRRIVCLQGDSAFGFSAMEMETVIRYHLKIIFIIINNNGIYQGLSKEKFQRFSQNVSKDDELVILPPTALLPDANYEKLAEAFDGISLSARTCEEVHLTLRQAVISSKAVILNIHIDPENQFPFKVKRYTTNHDEEDIRSRLTL